MVTIAKCLRSDMLCIESAISGVEPRHEGFETWCYARHQGNVERGFCPDVEVRQGVCRIGREMVPGKTDYPDNHDGDNSVIHN